jgi:integrase
LKEALSPVLKSHLAALTKPEDVAALMRAIYGYEGDEITRCALRLTALRRMGYTTEQMTAHGFRATARTILDEVLGVRPDFIEHQLAHAVHGPLGRAYNRTSHLPERRIMMQRWADYLEELRVNGVKTGGELVQMGKRTAC